MRAQKLIPVPVDAEALFVAPEMSKIDGSRPPVLFAEGSPTALIIHPETLMRKEISTMAKRSDLMTKGPERARIALC